MANPLSDLITFGGASAAEKAARKRAEDAQRAYWDLYGNLDAPEYDPINGSLAAGATADPNAVAAQQDTLKYLADRLAGGGLSMQDQAVLAQIRDRQNAQRQSDEKAVLERFASRGMLGSGDALSASLGAGQNAANMASMQGLQAAADREARMDALNQQRGGIASGVRSQSFGEKFSTGGAADEINKFNRNLRLMNFDREANLTANKYNAKLGNVNSTYDANMVPAQNNAALGQLAIDVGMAAAGLPSGAAPPLNAAETKKKY